MKSAIWIVLFVFWVNSVLCQTPLKNWCDSIENNSLNFVELVLRNNHDSIISKLHWPDEIKDKIRFDVGFDSFMHQNNPEITLSIIGDTSIVEHGILYLTANFIGDGGQSYNSSYWVETDSVPALISVVNYNGVSWENLDQSDLRLVSSTSYYSVVFRDGKLRKDLIFIRSDD